MQPEKLYLLQSVLWIAGFVIAGYGKLFACSSSSHSRVMLVSFLGSAVVSLLVIEIFNDIAFLSLQASSVGESSFFPLLLQILLPICLGVLSCVLVGVLSKLHLFTVR